MSATVEYRDLGLNRLMENLKELGELSITIGFQGEKGGAIHPGSSVTVATVAMMNEFGAVDSPARNFLRATMFERADDIARAFARESGAVATLKAEPIEAMSNVGRELAGYVREKIDQSPSWATANAPSTVAKKGHDHPLIGGDLARGIGGGTMLNAVGWAVRRGDAIVAEGT